MGPQQQNPYLAWLMSQGFIPSIPPIGQVQMPGTPPTQPMQQTQPQTQGGYIRGRTVESDADIKPNEVPMDGSLTLFPKSDLSCIYGKTWTQDGVLKALKFVPEQEVVIPQEEEKPQPVINEDVISNIVQQVVQDKMQEYFQPVITGQQQILDILSKPKTSSLIVKGE